MKIIKIDTKNPYSDQVYDILDKILYYGSEYLPIIFLKKVYLDGEEFYLPRWITQKHMNTIDKRTQELMNNLNWEEDDKR